MQRTDDQSLLCRPVARPPLSLPLPLPSFVQQHHSSCAQLAVGQSALYRAGQGGGLVAGRRRAATTAREAGGEICCMLPQLTPTTRSNARGASRLDRQMTGGRREEESGFVYEAVTCHRRREGAALAQWPRAIYCAEKGYCWWEGPPPPFRAGPTRGMGHGKCNPSPGQAKRVDWGCR